MDDVNDTTQTLDELEKSWNDSKDTVRALLGEDLTKSESTAELEDDLSKASKDSDMEYKEEEDDEDKEGEEEVDDKEAEGIKKSLSDEMSADPESAVAMDVEPFLQHLVKSISDQFDSIQVGMAELAEQNAELTKSMEASESMQKATAKLFLNYGELQKGMADTIEAIGNSPRKSGSVLRKSGDRFANAGTNEPVAMNKDQVMLKAMKLREDGKLSVRDVTKLENRLNKGIDIPEHIQKLLKEEK